jgi:mono/diheme cytochrome c family protein
MRQGKDIVRLVRGFLVTAILAVLAGCQGQPSDKAPIHLNPNMDDQEKYQPYEASRFFADGAAMRTPPPGTVARGELHDDVPYFTGFLRDTLYVPEAPVEVTMPELKRGQERFDIYCSPCHGRTGDGRGIMATRGYPPPPSFHDDRIRGVADGYIFNVITNGIRNMPSYRHQVPVADRWAIVLYLRALQRSQNASLNDVPEERRGTLK